MGIRGKSVLITGPAGIGKRLAMGFAEAGARVGLLSRSQAELDLAKLEIEQAGGNALRIRADVGISSRCRRPPIASAPSSAVSTS